MDGRKLQDRIYLGYGSTARHVGRFTDAFRPNGPFNPLDQTNRFLRLPATFVSTNGTSRRTNVYGDALWHGIFDASYTRPGDYLMQDSSIYFVASQAPLLPVLCVLANRVISVARPAMQSSVAGNTYGGYTSGSANVLMSGWPVSVLAEDRLGSSPAKLPADQTVPYLRILLPAGHGIILSPGDLLADDLDRAATIESSELTELGWRVSAKMATT